MKHAKVIFVQHIPLSNLNILGNCYTKWTIVVAHTYLKVVGQCILLYVLVFTHIHTLVGLIFAETSLLENELESVVVQINGFAIK